MIMEIKENDIIIADKKIFQFLSKHRDSGVIIQDIHTKKHIVPIRFIDRKANKDEVKWFCENTENIDFKINPTTK